MNKIEEDYLFYLEEQFENVMCFVFTNYDNEDLTAEDKRVILNDIIAGTLDSMAGKLQEKFNVYSKGLEINDEKIFEYRTRKTEHKRNREINKIN